MATPDACPPPETPSAGALATGLVRMVFALVEQDVRDLIAGGNRVPEPEDVLVHTWHHAIYGSTP